MPSRPTELSKAARFCPGSSCVPGPCINTRPCSLSSRSMSWATNRTSRWGTGRAKRCAAACFGVKSVRSRSLAERLSRRWSVRAVRAPDRWRRVAAHRHLPGRVGKPNLSLQGLAVVAATQLETVRERTVRWAALWTPIGRGAIATIRVVARLGRRWPVADALPFQAANGKAAERAAGRPRGLSGTGEANR